MQKGILGAVSYTHLDVYKRQTFDSSIIAQRKKGGIREPASEEYKCEIVSPILEYEDLEDLQEIVLRNRILWGLHVFHPVADRIH